MNFKGAIKVYRKELRWLKELSDPEFRLYMLYRCMAAWDEKRTNYFGIAKVTIKDVRDVFRWSTGKTSTTNRSLIKKGYIKPNGPSRFKIHNFKLLNGRILSTGKEIHSSENNLLRDENAIHPNEITRVDVSDTTIEKVIEIQSIPVNIIQPIESPIPPKEIHIENSDTPILETNKEQFDALRRDIYKNILHKPPPEGS